MVESEWLAICTNLYHLCFETHTFVNDSFVKVFPRQTFLLYSTNAFNLGNFGQKLGYFGVT